MSKRYPNADIAHIKKNKEIQRMERNIMGGYDPYAVGLVLIPMIQPSDSDKYRPISTKEITALTTRWKRAETAAGEHTYSSAFKGKVDVENDRYDSSLIKFKPHNLSKENATDLKIVQDVTQTISLTILGQPFPMRQEYLMLGGLPDGTCNAIMGTHKIQSMMMAGAHGERIWDYAEREDEFGNDHDPDTVFKYSEIFSADATNCQGFRNGLDDMFTIDLDKYMPIWNLIWGNLQDNGVIPGKGVSKDVAEEKYIANVERAGELLNEDAMRIMGLNHDEIWDHITDVNQVQITQETHGKIFQIKSNTLEFYGYTKRPTRPWKSPGGIFFSQLSRHFTDLNSPGYILTPPENQFTRTTTYCYTMAHGDLVPHRPTINTINTQPAFTEVSDGLLRHSSPVMRFLTDEGTPMVLTHEERLKIDLSEAKKEKEKEKEKARQRRGSSGKKRRSSGGKRRS